jgi:predicted nucleic-acid-binding protein
VESLTADAPGFVSTITLVETVWVLARAYKTAKADIPRHTEATADAKVAFAAQGQCPLATFLRAGRRARLHRGGVDETTHHDQYEQGW